MLGLVVGIVLLGMRAAYAQDEGIDTDLLLRTAEGTDKLKRKQRHHYGENGYPEAADGSLSIRIESGEPVVHMKDEVQPYVLYAQYQNQQRAGVFLARTGPHADTLPNGKRHTIPRGYGALKRSVIDVSIVEAQVIPHVSDQRNQYLQFPLQDLYVGGQLGSTGLYGTVRYVNKERWVGAASVGLNPFAQQGNDDWEGYTVPIVLSGGLRQPGFFSQYIGENAWTVGGSLFAGAGGAGFVLPGAFIELERFRKPTGQARKNHRRDARPYSYEVQAFTLRLGAYLNVGNWGQGRVIVPTISLGYQFNLFGPRIPKHDFKKTEVVYVHDIYRDQLMRQKERREERGQQE